MLTSPIVYHSAVSPSLMSLVPSLANSSPLLQNSIPSLPLLLAASSSTALFAKTPTNMEITLKKKAPKKMFFLSPRARACLWMAIAMALHFGGYEFARSGALALFTSSETGFSNPSAYPFAIGLVTPVSLFLLYGYGLVLKASGPRAALRVCKGVSVGMLLTCTLLIKVTSGHSSVLERALVGILFVFQNSYAHLIYTQQWSFLGSVMTPSEGTKWFSSIAGISSIVCTVTASLVRNLAVSVGLLGLIVGTAAGLALSMLLADRAYQLGEEHGFDPSDMMQRKQEQKDESTPKDEASLLARTGGLFRRVPTLAALFAEVITFQSLSTVLNVCFVRHLKEGVPLDTERASFTGRFYAYINGSAGFMQFFVLPMARRYLEPKWVYRTMPVILLPLLIYSALQTSSLWIAAAAFFSLKTLDYSVRNVVNEMVYQPLDFDSRYVGKEVIGVFANRFGKSGMSMILSAITPLGIGVTQLSQLAVVVASLWTSSTFWLSRNLLSNQEAEVVVQERQKK